MTIRLELEEIEKQTLSEHACFSSYAVRLKSEQEDGIRTPFMRDRDRIIHCKSFRRLKHKTQVFFSPNSDHYRTRMTHTLEVSQIARTIAKALRLNETLTEAIALGHDLGHTPFGHAGEELLNKKSKSGFKHWVQSLRVVDVLEKDGAGLNLTNQVRDGILKHSKGKGDIIPKNKNKLAATLEGQIVRISDIIAYVNHDIDDAIRAGIIKQGDIPQNITAVLGDSHSKRIATMVKSVIYTTKRLDYEMIALDDDILNALNELRSFLFKYVYYFDSVIEEVEKSFKILGDLFDYFMENVDKIEKHYAEDREKIVIDYISGMTDRYALNLYSKVFLPKPWGVV